jgi:hypothetical protein
LNPLVDRQERDHAIEDDLNSVVSTFFKMVDVETSEVNAKRVPVSMGQ